MRVFNEEMYFHFIGEVFLYSLLHMLINLFTHGSYTSIFVSAQVGLARGKVSRK
jgi:hypothetical protein